MSHENASPLPATEPIAENPVTDEQKGQPEMQLPTWEDDETVGTRLLRAVFVLVAGGLLCWSQWHTPYPSGQYWGRWVLTSVVFNFVIPLGIVWMFFGQGLWHLDWLKDQRNNAWDYGWHWKEWKRYLKIALIVWLISIPILYLASRDESVRANYAAYLMPVNSPQDWAILLGSLVVYMFCWEWFFRGFSLFGMAQGFGPIAAILLQAVVFGFSHAGKPPVEMASSFAGGLALGVLCWREKSFVPAFLIHAFIHLTWAVFVLR